MCITENPPVYNVWNFTSCDKRFGRKHPGQIPGQAVINLLARKLTPERQKLRLDAIRLRQELGWSERQIAGHLSLPRTTIQRFLAHNNTHEMAHNATPLSPNTIYCMDCLDGLSRLPHDSVDLVFADPPYNIGMDYGNGNTSLDRHEAYYDWCSEWFRAVNRILKPGGELIVKVPNLKCAFRSILEGPVEKYDWLMIYGQQTAKGEYHYNGFTLETLRNLAKNVGNLKDIKVEETNWDKFGVKSELTLTAKKIASSEPPSLAKVWGKEAEQSKPITEITEIPAEPTKKKLGRPKKQKQGESDVGKDS